MDFSSSLIAKKPTQIFELGLNISMLPTETFVVGNNKQIFKVDELPFVSNQVQQQTKVARNRFAHLTSSGIASKSKIVAGGHPYIEKVSTDVFVDHWFMHPTKEFVRMSELFDLTRFDADTLVSASKVKEKLLNHTFLRPNCKTGTKKF